MQRTVSKKLFRVLVIALLLLVFVSIELNAEWEFSEGPLGDSSRISKGVLSSATGTYRYDGREFEAQCQIVLIRDDSEHQIFAIYIEDENLNSLLESNAFYDLKSTDRDGITREYSAFFTGEVFSVIPKVDPISFLFSLSLKGLSSEGNFSDEDLFEILNSDALQTELQKGGDVLIEIEDNESVREILESSSGVTCSFVINGDGFKESYQEIDSSFRPKEWIPVTVIDEFDDPVDVKCMRNSEPMIGRMTANYTDKNIDAYYSIEEGQEGELFSAFEFEYPLLGDTAYRIFIDTDYTLKIKDRDGKVYTTSVVASPDGYFYVEDTDLVVNILLKGGKVSFRLEEDTDYSPRVYIFSLSSADSFKECFEEIFGTD